MSNVPKASHGHNNGGMVHHIQGHRDIKSSSKLPQAFRIMRTNQSKHMNLHSKNKSSIKHSQQVLNNQVNQAVRQYNNKYNEDQHYQVDPMEWQKNISESQIASTMLESADLRH